MENKGPLEDQRLKSRRGRKSGMNVAEFLAATSGVTFVPSRETREHIVYAMRETGIYNKSALISLAIKNFNDMLQSEAMRRSQLEQEESISPANFRPTLNK